MTGSFDTYIGVDYSGAAHPDKRLPGLRVYRADRSAEPREVRPESGRPRHWTRREIAQWLEEQFQEQPRTIVGLDHAFSFPLSYMRQHGLTRWDQFLVHFRERWPTHHQAVEPFREANPWEGQKNELRVTEQWTTSAKSVFLFDVNGSVAKSTRAGLPWLLHFRERYGAHLHCWPFDGWEPPDHGHVLAEVYPSLFRNRYPKADRTPDQQDAYAVAKWLKTMDEHGALSRFFEPPLSSDDKETARLEGWILGVM